MICFDFKEEFGNEIQIFEFLKTLGLTTVDFVVTSPLLGTVSVGLKGDEALLRNIFDALDKETKAMVFFCYRPHPSFKPPRFNTASIITPPPTAPAH